jgi:hypothetical protein
MNPVFLLRASEGAHSVRVGLDRPVEGEECPIAREPIAEYDLPFLIGTTWLHGNDVLRCMSLPCGHRFSAMALAYHFMKNSMSCPLCRDGCKQTMARTCLPSHFKLTLLGHLAAESARERDEAERENLAEAMRIVREEVAGRPGSFLAFMRWHRITLTVYAYEAGDPQFPRAVCEYPMEVSLEGGGQISASLSRDSLRQLVVNLRLLDNPTGFVFVVGTRSLEGAVVLLDRSPYALVGSLGRVGGLTFLAHFEVATQGQELSGVRWVLSEAHFLALARLRVLASAPEIVVDVEAELLSANATPDAIEVD